MTSETIIKPGYRTIIGCSGRVPVRLAAQLLYAVLGPCLMLAVDDLDGITRLYGGVAYLAARQQRRDEAQAEDRAVRPLAPPEECCSEDDIRQRKPRILLTNFRQLEILTTRLPDVALFAEAPLKYLVFDEAHTYGGATGAEVACLIRRVRALAGKTADEILCIGTSATLSDPTKRDQDNDETARRFASRFFGVDAGKVKLVGESYVSREWPRQRYRPIVPHGDGMARLSRVLAAITEPVDLGGIKGVVEELTGQIFEPGDDWRESLFDHLVTNEYVFQTTQILKYPKRLNEAAWQTSQRIAMSRLAEGDRANAELLAYLVLGAAAQKGGESLLRPKVHFFLRGLDEMVVALDGTEPPQAAPVPVAERGQGAVRRSPRRRLPPGADLPKLRPALLREVRPGPGIRPRGQEPAQGLRARQRHPGRRRPGQRLLVHVARGDRHPAGPDQPAAGGSRRRADRPVRPLAEGVVLPPVRGDAPGAVAPLPGRWLRPQGAAAAADRLRARAVGLPVVQLALVPDRRAGRSNRPGRSRRSRSPTFTSWPRR